MSRYKPTTTASRLNAVCPVPSEVRPYAFTGAMSESVPALQVARLQRARALLEEAPVELAVRQAGEDLDAPHQRPEAVAQRIVGVARGVVGLNVPVRDERLARPFHEMLVGCDVAKRDDEVHARRAGAAEMLQALGARAHDRHVVPVEELDGISV